MRGQGEVLSVDWKKVFYVVVGKLFKSATANGRHTQPSIVVIGIHFVVWEQTKRKQISLFFKGIGTALL